MPFQCGTGIQMAKTRWRPLYSPVFKGSGHLNTWVQKIWISYVSGIWMFSIWIPTVRLRLCSWALAASFQGFNRFWVAHIFNIYTKKVFIFHIFQLSVQTQYNVIIFLAIQQSLSVKMSYIKTRQSHQKWSIFFSFIPHWF